MVITANLRDRPRNRRPVPVDRLPFPHPTLPGAMLVRLTRGLFATIDAVDAPEVGKRMWHSVPTRDNPDIFYASAVVDGKDKKLHRALWDWWGLPPAPLLDHKDGNALDCRRENLRPATKSLNGANSRLSRRNKSGFKGVKKAGRRWLAQIRGESATNQRIGLFDTPEEAHAAYLAKARELHGEFARAA